MRALHFHGGRSGWIAGLALAVIPLFTAARASAQTWTSQDIGLVVAAGSASSSGGQVNVAGGGSDIWGSADSFQYYYESFTGDGTFIARLASLQDTNAWAKAGLMFRETLAAGSREVMICGTAENGTNLTARTVTSGSTAMTGTSWQTILPVWLKIVRQGDNFTGYTSFDGAQWSQTGSYTLVSAPATLYVGFAVTSHDPNVLSHVVFDNVSLASAPVGAPVITSSSNASGLVGSAFSYTIQATNSPTQFAATGLPSWATLNSSTGVISGTPTAAGSFPITVTATNASGTGQANVTIGISNTGSAWTSQDIGVPAIAGSSNDNGATVNVAGSGADIWGTSDQFQFRYQPLTSDANMVARITGIDRTNQWAKAGLMIRTSLAADASYQWIGISAQNGSFAQTRTTAGASTQMTNPTWSTVIPTWVRIARQGDTIYSYVGTDGVMWTPVSHWTVSTSSAVYIGFAVTSHDNTQLCNATFDNVQLTLPGPAATPAAPTNITLTAPSPGQVNITWTDNSTNETQFLILRSTDNTTFGQIAQTGANVTQYEDTTVTGCTTYYYQVRAGNSQDVSPNTGSVSITTPTGSVWGYRDIGAVGTPGTNSSGTNTISVSGAGADIWGTTDAFRYVYRAMTGDVTVEAQVSSFTANQGWARAGVMIRESLDPTARNVFAFVTHDTLVAAQVRITTSTTLYSSGYNSQPWLRIVKSGSQVTVQKSVDDVNWTTIQTFNFPLGQTFYVGFAVCSHDTSQLATAVFTDPSVQ